MKRITYIGFWLLLHGFILSSWCEGQSAAPQIVGRDDGGGLEGISDFELYGNGLYWWKGGAEVNDVSRREGTLAVKPALGLVRFFLNGSSTRYLARGYAFQIDGAVRDDLYVYYSANGL